MREEFKKGIASGTCETDCGSCTFMGDPTASDSSKRPSYYCKNSKKGCKWVPDLVSPTDESKGRCAPTAEKSCEDKCDQCYDEGICTTYGAKKGDTNLDAQCSWDSASKICKPKSGAGEYELCWDGIDNNNDNKID